MKTTSKSDLQPPQLPRPLPGTMIETLENHAEYSACALSGSELNGQIAGDVLFDQVALQRVIAQQTQLTRLRLFDVRATGSDFSGAAWDKARLRRVEFNACRMLGLQLIEAQLDQVLFKDCNLTGAIFASAIFKGARFENCNLRETLFEQADLTGVIFRQCDLSQANLSGAKLEGADLRGSILNGMQVGAGELQGVLIDASQAVQVVGLLGVEIRALEPEDW